MKKILFIMSPILPFPPTKGGAVQNLVDQVIKINLYEKYAHISVASIKFDKQIKEELEYGDTGFEYVKIPRVLLTIRDRQIRFISGRLAVLIETLYLKGLKRILKRKSYDVIVFENTLKYACVVNKLLGQSIKILHLHNDYITNIPKSSDYLGYYNKVICISKYIEKLVLTSNSSITTSVVYNGINTEKFKRNFFDRDMMREKFGLTDKDQVILFSGRIVKEKGVLELVQAVNKMKTDVVLLILGSRIYGDNIKDLYTQQVLDKIYEGKKRVIFTGFVDYSEIHKYYSMSDIGVLPTLWEEPLSLSVIEYMSASLPLVISNSGGMVELIEEKCGFVVNKDFEFVDNLALSLDTILGDKVFYNEACKEVLKRSKFFDSKVYTELMIKELISNKREYL